MKSNINNNNLKETRSASSMKKIKSIKKANYEGQTKARVTKEVKKANDPIPNGFFKKRVFSFGLCFSWFITIFCLLFGEAQNIIHTQLAVCSFLTGVAFIFALVFKGKINTAWFKYDESDKNN